MPASGRLVQLNVGLHFFQQTTPVTSITTQTNQSPTTNDLVEKEIKEITGNYDVIPLSEQELGTQMSALYKSAVSVHDAVQKTEGEVAETAKKIMESAEVQFFYSDFVVFSILAIFQELNKFTKNFLQNDFVELN